MSLVVIVQSPSLYGIFSTHLIYLEKSINTRFNLVSQNMPEVVLHLIRPFAGFYVSARVHLVRGDQLEVGKPPLEYGRCYRLRCLAVG